MNWNYICACCTDIYSMTQINQQENNSTEHEAEEKDITEEVVHIMHIALPITGAILIFLIAFIAVFMA